MGAQDKRLLYLDFETAGSVDIGKCGSYKYIESPDFRVLLLAYAFGDEPVKLVDLASGNPWPNEILDALWDPDVVKIAHNTSFERAVINRVLGYTPPEQWEDTMILAATCGLPMSLDAVGKALNLPEDQAKMKEGKALIRYFCTPCKPTKANGGRTTNLPEHAPDKWQTFCEYCRRDVETMRTIYKALARWTPNEEEHRFFCLDARINEKGMKIDRQLVVNAIAMDRKYKDELTAKAVELTGLENPKSVSQIKTWLYDQESKEFPSLNKKVIADVVSQLQTDKAKEFLAIRSELSKSSTAKYEAMIRSVCDDGHIKGCFQFYGASRTGRFAGRLVQLQNLVRNEMEPLADIRDLVRNGRYTDVEMLFGGVSKVLSELIRTALIPEDGGKIMVADFSAIEARVIAWFAKEQWVLDAFQNGEDIYCKTASQMFKVPVVKHGVNGDLRQKGKVATLACGYAGGINALKAFGADKMGMTEEEMQETVDLWREANPNIVALWRDVERAAIRCVVRGGTVVSQKGIRFDMERGVLWLSLPSGRRLAYWGAKYEDSKRNPGRKALSYMGVNQTTKKWERIETFSGRIVENLVQATARDCLREAMFALDEAGYDIRAHVHDEVIVSEPLNGRPVEDMADLMGRPIPWAPGLPLRADGYETPFYRKD